jgi:tryptophan-rich sensory protein
MSLPPVKPLWTWAGLGAWLLLCFLAATTGALFPPGTWYVALEKPSWNPPAWVFGPVWTALYIMMALAAWRVWRRGGFVAQRRTLTPFLIQLALNAAWSPLFFGLHRPDLAFVNILLLLGAIVWTMTAFARVDRIAAGLLLPYLLWVAFATVLNGVLWRLNA